MTAKDMIDEAIRLRDEQAWMPPAEWTSAVERFHAARMAAYGGTQVETKRDLALLINAMQEMSDALEDMENAL